MPPTKVQHSSKLVSQLPHDHYELKRSLDLAFEFWPFYQPELETSSLLGVDRLTVSSPTESSQPLVLTCFQIHHGIPFSGKPRRVQWMILTQ